MRSHLDLEDKDPEEENSALSAFIFAVSLFFVSENCVAITTKHRLIMKNDPIWKLYKSISVPFIFSYLPQWDTQNKSSSKKNENPINSQFRTNIYAVLWTWTKYMTSVHPSSEITRNIATQARPMLSKDMAPWKGFVGPVVHLV